MHLNALHLLPLIALLPISTHALPHQPHQPQKRSVYHLRQTFTFVANVLANDLTPSIQSHGLVLTLPIDSREPDPCLSNFSLQPQTQTNTTTTNPTLFYASTNTTTINLAPTTNTTTTAPSTAALLIPHAAGTGNGNSTAPAQSPTTVQISCAPRGGTHGLSITSTGSETVSGLTYGSGSWIACPASDSGSGSDSPLLRYKTAGTATPAGCADLELVPQCADEAGGAVPAGAAVVGCYDKGIW